jgi:D-alanyl-D-alanine carboxypeptidase (penicillin-binding protein 5/6)
VGAAAALLMDMDTGQVLFARNERARAEPAGLTKLLAALVVLDYADPDGVVTVGNEIYSVARGARLAGHRVGETITVRALLRGLLTRGGDDSGNALAAYTAALARDNDAIPYAQAERIFVELMNEKAAGLGALDTRVTNHNGLRSEEHYTTAYDIALIGKAFMERPLLREIAAETAFAADRIVGDEVSGRYDWTNPNELVREGPYGYVHAAGIAADPANGCLVASAERRDIRLLAVLFGARDAGLWLDARRLFDYGYDTFGYVTVQAKDSPLGTAAVTNPRLGSADTLGLLADDAFTGLLSEAEAGRVTRALVYDERFIEPEAEGFSLRAPIEQDETLGRVVYYLDGQILFEGTFRAAEPVPERTLDSDMDYYIALVRGNIFTIRALPYWAALGGTAFGVAGVCAAVSQWRRGRRSMFADYKK